MWNTRQKKIRELLDEASCLLDTKEKQTDSVTAEELHEGLAQECCSKWNLFSFLSIFPFRKHICVLMLLVIESFLFKNQQNI